MEEVAKHVVYSGRVQGVGFRFTAERIARRYGLVGFVKNLPTGQVEMVAQGHADDVTNCLRDISETFGRGITDADCGDIAVNGRYTDFGILF
ncbi:MAG: acylphosphatase [Planctomycetes bacterium]|nr:acylphosphatase [Planctomycetota bacterium]